MLDDEGANTDYFVTQSVISILELWKDRVNFESICSDKILYRLIQAVI